MKAQKSLKRLGFVLGLFFILVAISKLIFFYEKYANEVHEILFFEVSHTTKQIFNLVFGLFLVFVSLIHKKNEKNEKNRKTE